MRADDPLIRLGADRTFPEKWYPTVVEQGCAARTSGEGTPMTRPTASSVDDRTPARRRCIVLPPVVDTNQTDNIGGVFHGCTKVAMSTNRRAAGAPRPRAAGDLSVPPAERFRQQFPGLQLGVALSTTPSTGSGGSRWGPGSWRDYLDGLDRPGTLSRRMKAWWAPGRPRSSFPTVADSAGTPRSQRRGNLNQPHLLPRQRTPGVSRCGSRESRALPG